MKTYVVEIPSWVFAFLEQGHISFDEFTVLVALHRWFDRNPNVMCVRSYSAERVCRFCQLDATDANERKFQRAVNKLRALRILNHDYVQGSKRPYNVWWTLKKCSLFVQPNSPTGGVGYVVGDEFNANDTSCGVYEEHEDEHVGDVVGDVVGDMLPNNQCAGIRAEKEPPKSPAGGLPPSAPMGERCAGPPPKSPSGGLSTGLTRKALTAEQSRRLDELTDEFVLAWHSHLGFLPNESHMKALLRRHSPWEIVVAYYKLRQPARNNNKAKSVFFARGAATAIREARRRRDSTQFHSGSRNVCGGYDLFQSEWETGVQACKSFEDRWRDIFGLPHEDIKLSQATPRNISVDSVKARHPKRAGESAKVEAEAQRATEAANQLAAFDEWKTQFFNANLLSYDLRKWVDERPCPKSDEETMQMVEAFILRHQHRESAFAEWHQRLIDDAPSDVDAWYKCYPIEDFYSAEDDRPGRKVIDERVTEAIVAAKTHAGKAERV